MKRGQIGVAKTQDSWLCLEDRSMGNFTSPLGRPLIQDGCSEKHQTRCCDGTQQSKGPPYYNLAEVISNLTSI